jgi:hypothetical protein
MPSSAGNLPPEAPQIMPQNIPAAAETETNIPPAGASGAGRRGLVLVGAAFHIWGRESQSSHRRDRRTRATGAASRCAALAWRRRRRVARWWIRLARRLARPRRRRVVALGRSWPGIRGTRRAGVPVRLCAGLLPAAAASLSSSVWLRRAASLLSAAASYAAGVRTAALLPEILVVLSRGSAAADRNAALQRLLGLYDARIRKTDRRLMPSCCAIFSFDSPSQART